ncbi:BolA family transcriptional regulator [Parvibaculaceae bacterium PLY_AMNH_Bact1]|nr:BolA family transcriptional regulator [Parvibaculaceae bacterium PLY_AMNH_Bact1]
MTIAEQIEEIVSEALQPVRLEVADKSHLHAGHAGARPEGETHFHLTIVSSQFEGENRVARHRRVNALLADLLADRVHAMQLKTLTPEEDGA